MTFKWLKGFRTTVGGSLLAVSTVAQQIQAPWVPPWVPIVGQGLGTILFAFGIKYRDSDK